MDVGKKRGRPCKDVVARENFVGSRLSDLELEMLECLSRRDRVSKSEFIRKLVVKSFEESDVEYGEYYINPEETDFEEEW